METPSYPLPDNSAQPGYAGLNTGNPVLDEISAAHAKLSPQAQQAIEDAHENLGISPSHSDPALVASTSGASPEVAVPGVSGPRGPLPNLSPEIPAPRPIAVTGGTPMADVNPPGSGVDPSLLAHSSDSGSSVSIPVPGVSSSTPLPGESELMRLRANGPGVNQIHSPIARGFAKVGDVLGSTFARGLASNIPGTTAHNLQLQDRAEKEATEEQTSAKSAADIARTEAETQHLGSEPPPTITTDKGIMQWNPETHVYDIQAGKPAPKEEMEGKTVTTAEGVMAWNPQTKKYDQKVGDAPEDKGAITHFLDKDGNAWKLNHDGSATPIKGPEGSQLKGTPTGPEGEKPLQNVDQMNKALESRWQVLHPHEKIPEHFIIPTNATQKDYDRIDKALESTERAFGTKAQQEQVNEMRKQTLALAAQNRGEKTDTTLKGEVLKYFAPAQDSAERFNVMTKNYDDALKGDQQAMLSLLANHIGMTMGLQKGARINQAMYQEAQKSLPWLESIKAKFGKDGYLTGVTLSPEQMRQMVDLGRERFAEDITKARNSSQYLGAKDDGPKRTMSESTVDHYLRVNGNDPAKAKAMAIKDGWSVE